MNFDLVKRDFKSDPSNPGLAQHYIDAVRRTVGYDNLSDFDKALYLGANITANHIPEDYVRYCASLNCVDK